jgi:hypothetical protein
MQSLRQKGYRELTPYREQFDYIDHLRYNNCVIFHK